MDGHFARKLFAFVPNLALARDGPTVPLDLNAAGKILEGLRRLQRDAHFARKRPITLALDFEMTARESLDIEIDKTLEGDLLVQNADTELAVKARAKPDPGVGEFQVQLPAYNVIGQLRELGKLKSQQPEQLRRSFERLCHTPW